MALQQMVVDGLTFVTNPDKDSDFFYKRETADFLPIDAVATVTQDLGYHSGERTFEGYFQSDTAYATLEASYRLGNVVSITDWKGNTWQVIILDLKPAFVMDVNTAFQTRTYMLTVRKVG